MKGSMKFIFLTVMIFLGIGDMCSFAQDSSSKLIPEWDKKVNKVLNKQISVNLFKDSIAMYTYNLKLKIVKSKNGISKVKHILASDTLLYRIFPNYKELYIIDYSSLLSGRNEVNLVIPVLVYSLSPTGKSKYQKQDSQPLVSIQSAMEINQTSLISLLPKDMFEDIVLMRPVVITIFNIQ
jgi:hypothetical protein